MVLDVFLQLASVQVNPRESADCGGQRDTFLEKCKREGKKMKDFSDFPRSRSAYGTFLYSRIHVLEKPNGGEARQAEATLTLRPRRSGKKEKDSAQMTQAGPSLDACVIARAALPRTEKTKKKRLADDAEE